MMIYFQESARSKTHPRGSRTDHGYLFWFTITQRSSHSLFRVRIFLGDEVSLGNVLEVRWYAMADLRMQLIWVSSSGPSLRKKQKKQKTTTTTKTHLKLTRSLWKSHNGFGLLGLLWYAQIKNYLRSTRILANLSFSGFLGFLECIPQKNFFKSFNI